MITAWHRCCETSRRLAAESEPSDSPIDTPKPIGEAGTTKFDNANHNAGNIDKDETVAGEAGAEQPAAETLAAHWQRIAEDEAAASELKALLDVIGFARVRETMSDKFSKDMRETQPTKLFLQHNSDTQIEQITKACTIGKIESLGRGLLKFVADIRRRR
jgi:hypothetical protein